MILALALAHSSLSAVALGLALACLGVSFVVSSGDFPRAYRRDRVVHFAEGASQTFIANELVKLITTAGKGNKIQVGTATDADGTRVGLVLDKASTVEDTMLPVAVFDESVEILIAVADTQTLDANNIGSEFGIVRDATNNIWRLDKTNTTQKIFRVVGLAPGYLHGDVNGKYLVRVAVGKAAVFAS